MIGCPGRRPVRAPRTRCWGGVRRVAPMPVSETVAAVQQQHGISIPSTGTVDTPSRGHACDVAESSATPAPLATRPAIDDGSTPRCADQEGAKPASSQHRSMKRRHTSSSPFGDGRTNTSPLRSTGRTCSDARPHAPHGRRRRSVRRQRGALPQERRARGHGLLRRHAASPWPGTCRSNAATLRARDSTDEARWQAIAAVVEPVPPRPERPQRHGPDVPHPGRQRKVTRFRCAGGTPSSVRTARLDVFVCGDRVDVPACAPPDRH